MASKCKRHQNQFEPIKCTAFGYIIMCIRDDRVSIIPSRFYNILFSFVFIIQKKLLRIFQVSLQLLVGMKETDMYSILSEIYNRMRVQIQRALKVGIVLFNEYQLLSFYFMQFFFFRFLIINETKVVFTKDSKET